MEKFLSFAGEAATSSQPRLTQDSIALQSLQNWHISSEQIKSRSAEVGRQIASDGQRYTVYAGTFKGQDVEVKEYHVRGLPEMTRTRAPSTALLAILEHCNQTMSCIMPRRRCHGQVRQ